MRHLWKSEQVLVPFIREEPDILAGASKLIVFDSLGAQWLLRQDWVSLSWVALFFGDTECEVPALIWGSTGAMRDTG